LGNIRPVKNNGRGVSFQCRIWKGQRNISRRLKDIHHPKPFQHNKPPLIVRE
jgi:hypothetical protein